MTNRLLFRSPDRFALYRVIGRVIGQVLWSLVPALLLTVSFTSTSLAQEPVFSNDSMQWEGEAVTEAKEAANEFDQDRSVLALDAARNLGEHNMLLLPAPDADEVARRMTPTDDADRKPQQTGFIRAVNGFAQLPPSPAGTRLGSDGRDYAVSQRLLGSAGAVSIRLHFSGVVLPAGARLYVYGLADGAQPKGYDSAWLGDRASFWSHTIPGDRAVVEYHTPLDSGTTDRPASYTVDQVVHNVVGIFGHSGAVISADAAACHLDMCDNQAWQVVGNGVMRLIFISGSSTFGCSGALLNDKTGSGTPYIYTANHCISTQAEAATVELAYFYQRNRCSDDPDSNTVTRLGATLLATGAGRADFTLLRASTSPPNGATFLGWTTNSIATGTRVIGIHHPEVDFKRISFGEKIVNYSMEHIVRWSSGAVEFGSSGSPAIINGPGRSSAQVIGTQTRATQPFCGTSRRVHYGKFSAAWPSFQRYLEPDNSDVPDLIVDNVSVSSSPHEPGVSFTINATVRNRGNGTAAATTLRYVRSTDAVITADDTQLATTTVSVLAPHGSSPQSATVSIANAGVYWVGACASTANGETATDNNCSTGVRVTVAAPTLPDLTVGNVSVSNTTPASGANFTINATARNSGNRAAAATTLRYYRSNDNTIGRTDTQFGTSVVGGLAPGGSSLESATVSITNTGVYWVGACILTVSGETATGNNCSTGVAVTVSVPAVPDLLVDTVTVSDSSVENGASFTINATVRNSGDAAAAVTTLHYVRSDDATIDASDTELTTDNINGLEPGGSSSQNASVSITEPGTWWVGACVDAVNDEVVMGNNCSTGVEIAVTAPDLTVQNVSVSDASVETGDSFTINATVRNSGDAASGATTLRYYRSTDNTITADDTQLGMDPVAGLAPGADSPENVSVSIADAEAWWVGACVETVNGESETGNNCSTGVEVTVSVPAVPDLLVDTVSVADSSVVTGTSFTINATVRNSGDAASAVTALHYVRSDDATITSDDTELTTDNISGLEPGGSSSQNASVSITNPGTWWVGACVGTVNGEVVMGNNCSAGEQVTITAPDLIVQNVSVSDSSVEPDDSFTINATVRNSGDAASGLTTLRYYRSTDNTITADDTELTTDSVNGLAPNGSSSQNASVSITNTGAWWVGACVGTVSGESVTGNNCSTGVQVAVSLPAVPDLLVDTVSVTNPTLVSGTSFTINATVRNSGTAASGATTLRYYRSTDNTITANDTQLGNDAVDVLAPNTNSPENISVSIADTGTWWVGACVATVNGETATGNNCSTGVQVTVTAPDLVVVNVGVSASTPSPGASFTINATARNSGNVASAATTLRYYRSTNNTITANDTQLGTDPVGALAAGANSPQSISVSIANTGTWWVGACVATVSGESARGNNCSTGVQVTVTALSIPDLIVVPVSVSTSTPASGASFTINATVRNSGAADAGATTLRYYRSDDNTITTDDRQLGTNPVSALAFGTNSRQSVSVSIADTGTWWVGACVATVNGETATGNNCSTGVQVTVTAPDLIVENVSVTESSVEASVAFTINATVQNQGTGAAVATTLRYYGSDDSTITMSDTELASEPVATLAADASSQQSAEVLLTDAGTWWVGACVVEVNDEVVTGNNCSTGVQVTVTAADLTVDSISVAESSVEASVAFTINATVQNRGTGASVATTLRYFGSHDSTITVSDTELASEPVATLAADASSQQSAEVLLTDAGTWWVGACVVEVNDEIATDNNCSAGVQVTITARPDNNDDILPAIIHLLLDP